MKLLKQLCEAHGVSGFEDEVRGIIKKSMKPLVDEIKCDVMGNVIGLKKGKGKIPEKS